MTLIHTSKFRYYFQKAVCGLLLFAVLFTQLLNFPIPMPVASAEVIAPAQPPNDPEVVYDLIAVVVDTDIDKDSTNYVGLRDQYANELEDFTAKVDGSNITLSGLTMSERVMRYAEDLRESNNLTDVKILFYDKNKDSVTDLAVALENLYLNGDSTHNNRLIGAVFVGDIPMPVVNKNGNRFMSLFPYVDFEDKAFTYNSQTESYELNKDNIFPKPDIWHGIIKPPTAGVAGKEALADFFDKNHLYYLGVPEFAKFDKRVFFGDLVNEEKNMNKDVYIQYLKYLEDAEDLVYQRFNKFWANEVTSSVISDLPMGELTDFGQEFLTDAMSPESVAGMPDIYAKNIIEQFLSPYYKVFSKYISKTNDFVKNTGRYGVDAGDSIPKLITIKDEYTKYYLRAVNEAIEKKVNEVVSMIEEPMPLIKKATMSGHFLNGDGSNGAKLKLHLSGGLFPFEYYNELTLMADIIGDTKNDNVNIDSIGYKFHYDNEIDNKFYVNGVDGDLISDAKLCAPYLGSTKTAYFDENMQFNPTREGVDGDYSVLTRSLRSDSLTTAQIYPTIGVNTRPLSSDEAFDLTGGKASNGAVIEASAITGMPAFINNPLYSKDDDYPNPLKDVMQEGDVIVKINDEPISSSNPVEVAIKNTYTILKNVIQAINDGNADSLEGFPYQIAMKPGNNLNQGNIDKAVGNISIEFYRGAQKHLENFTFTVQKYGSLSRSEPIGAPLIIVLFSNLGFSEQELNGNAVYGMTTDGAIFGLYDTEGGGFNTDGYDPSSGCNLNSSNKNSDRCFPLLAMMPVLDPGGSTSLVPMTLPGMAKKLLFPENVAKDNQNKMSADPEDYANHMFNFQFPGGGADDYYQYEDIDEVYYNYCYNGLVSVESPDEDSNPYRFPLDPSTIREIDFGVLQEFFDVIPGYSLQQFISDVQSILGIDGTPYYDIDQDTYGQYLNHVGMFVEWQRETPPGKQRSEFTPKVFDFPTAGEVVLNSSGTKVTLKDFSDHYGLFDGIDNNGNGIIDYTLADEDNDGLYEKRVYDVAEGAVGYGIPDWNMGEISRKLLSHASSYVLPKEVSGFGQDVKLDVTVDPYVNSESGEDQILSSMILHNEPTEHTIMQQLIAQGTMSLPIDDPRYVAFQSKPLPSIPGVPTDVVHNYYPGSSKKINYPNLFDYSNDADLMVALDQTAWALTKSYGSYKVKNPAQPIDCTTPVNNPGPCGDIHDEILSEYLLPAVNYSGAMDNPNDVDIEQASVKKVHDALLWKNLNIDKKHIYIFNKYLNDGENAYAGDATLFPAPQGYDLSYGYEMAMLVMAGNHDYLDIKFNKDIPEESSPLFNPLILGDGEDANGGLWGADGIGADGGNGGGGGQDDEFEFVMLDQFLEETTEFLEFFTKPPEFEDCCGYSDKEENEIEAALEGVDIEDIINASLSALPLKTLELSVNKETISASSTENLVVEIRGYDENGKLVGPYSEGLLINLDILQNEDDPLVSLSGYPQKVLLNGVTTFELKTTGKPGNIVLGASSQEGIQSNSENIKITLRKIELASFTYYVPEGIDDLGDGGDGGDGNSNGDGGAGGEDWKDTGVGFNLDNFINNGGGSGDGSNGGSGDGSGDGAGTGNGSDAGDGSVTGDGSGDAAGGGDGSGDGGGSGTGAGNESGNQDGSEGGDASGSGTGSGVANDGSGLTNSGEDLKKILADIDENSGDGSTDGSGDGSNGDGSAVVILKSDPVETFELDSTPVEDGDSAETSENTGTEAGDGGQSWQEYYLIENYYKKFLDVDLSGSIQKPRLFAEVFSDRMLAFIPDEENPFIDAYVNDESKYKVEPGDEMVADNESLMMISASIFNNDGKLETDGVHNVKFSIVEANFPNLVTFENGDTAESEYGVATIYLRAGKKTGNFKIQAQVVDGNGNTNNDYPKQTKELYLVAGEPVCLAIESDSCPIPADVDPCNPNTTLPACVLVANSQSKTNLMATIRDKFGNTANNAFANVSLFAPSEVFFDEKMDTDGNIVGIQIGTVEGIAAADLFAKDKTGIVKTVALLMGYEVDDAFIEAGDDWTKIDFSNFISSSRKIELLDSVSLEIKVNKQSIKADGSSIMKISTKLLHDGQVVKNYSGPINFKILTENLGSFVSAPPKNMAEGILIGENARFKSSTLAGEVEILVEVPGFASNTIKFKTTPGDPASVQLTANSEHLYSDGFQDVVLEGRLLDANGNLVNEANGTGVLVNFTTTPATSDFVVFPNGQNALSSNGIAYLTVEGGDISGEASIIATAEGIAKPATLSLDVTKHITREMVNDFVPRSLYISLLGDAYGNFSDFEKNLSETLLYSKKEEAGKKSLSQVQAISSITFSPDDKKRLIGVEPTGKVNVMGEGIIASVIASTDSFPYQKIIFAEDVDGLELATVFMIPKANSEMVLLEKDQEFSDINGYGIFVKRVFDGDPSIEFLKKDDGIYIERNGEVKIKIAKDGRIYQNDDSYEISLFEDDGEVFTDDLVFSVYNGAGLLANIDFSQNLTNDVTYLEYDEDLANEAPGMYLQSNSISSRYAAKQAFSGISTESPKGLYFLDLDNTIDPGQAPGLAYSSLEKGKDQFGLGFEGQNKHMLFFAAGNTLGESHLPYGSEVGVIYGDPNIRLKIGGVVGLISDITGFTKMIGESLFTSDEDITELIDFDYNGDGLDDLLLLYEDGRVRLLMHEISNKHFRDKGYILNVFGGIYAATKLDVNNDGFDDLIVGTKESCIEGDKTVSLFTNLNGSLERKTLNLGVSGNILDMASDDMNDDGCDDIVVSDSAGNIRVFYNKNDGAVCQGIETNYGYGKNFGYSMDSDVDQKQNIFINYSGMEQLYEGDPAKDYQDSNSYKFVNFVLQSENPPADPLAAGYAASVSEINISTLNNPALATADLPPLTYPKHFDFIHLPADPKFGNNSKKIAIDVNAETLAAGDKVNYVVTLQNDSGVAVSNMMISDLTPTSITLDLESLECLDNNCPDNLEWEATGMKLRSHVIKNISVPANGKRIIKYAATINEMPEINFELGNYDGENYSDIFVKPAFNPDGELTYLYSKQNLSAKGYNDYLAAAPPVDEPNDLNDSLNDAPFDFNVLKALGQFAENSTEFTMDEVDPNNPPDPPPPPSPELAKKIAALTAPADKNTDGCPDSWGVGSVQGAVDDALGAVGGALGDAADAAGAVANGIESALSALRCSGSCLPIFYNYVFLAPDDALPGFPVFSAGHSWPVGIGSMIPSYVPSTFRLYVMPTLTLGLGIGICSGVSTTSVSPCYAFSIPISQMSGLCDAISGGLNGAIAAAKDAVTNPDVGMSSVASDGTGGSEGDSDTTAGDFAYSDPDSPVSAAGAANIKIPGFPAVITNWIDKQWDEIYNKLLDLPTFYFIYPDFKTLISDHAIASANFSKIQNVHDLLRAMNSLPLVQIESKEVLVKIPALSQAEIIKWQRQAQAWVEYEKSEIDRVVDYYGCLDPDHEAANPDSVTLCDKFLVDTSELLQSVQALMDKVDKISHLPRDVLNWKTLESKYAMQIICYLDAIMKFTGGYIRKQSKIVKSWVKAGDDIIKTFKSWRAILDLALEYEESCDQCKNDRFSKLGLLMQLFVAIPEPPIIPLPKWPDIVVDFSQIKTGIKIVWPDLVFRPEPIKLPDIPTFTFPDVLPEFTLELPGFDIPWLDFPIFTLPDLPDLPTLMLPKLPDLPRPPKIPALPNVVVKLLANLKVIFKILCLIKNGLIPITEGKLATEIETLTQPNVKVVLPIIAQLGVQLPEIEYDYVDQIRIIGKFDIGIDLSTIYLAVKAGAEIMNEGVEMVVDKINEYTRFNLQPFVDAAIENAVKKLIEEAAAGVEAGVDAVDDAVSYTPVIDTNFDFTLDDFSNIPEIADVENSFDEINDVLNEYVATLESESEDYQDVYNLVATPMYLDPSDPLLNRSLDEIEMDMRDEELPDTPEMKRLYAMREALIDYTRNLNDTNKSLNDSIDNYDQFSKILVDTDMNISDRLASLSLPYDFDSVEIKESEFPFFDEATVERINEAASLDDYSEILIAANVEDPVGNVSQYVSGEKPAPLPAGFFIATDQGNASVLSYVSEMSRTFHMLFSNVDSDSDADIVFSMGGDVYYKENYKANDIPASYIAKGDVILGVNNNAISDFVPEGGTAVQGVKSPDENNKQADLNWTAIDGSIAYEIIVRRSLLHGIDDYVYKYTAIASTLQSENGISALETLGLSADSQWVLEIGSPANPSVSLSLENGNYYATIYAINAEGQKSLISNNSILAPQICADTEAPFPIIKSEAYEVALFKPLEVDASASFDVSSKIISYAAEPLPYTPEDPELSVTSMPAEIWSDLFSSIDNDGDGIVANDKNNPVLNIPIFDQPGDLGLHSFILKIADEKKLTSNQQFDVNVFVPDIVLDDTISRTKIATGNVDPPVADYPFSIYRSRYVYRSVEDELFVFPRNEKIITPSANDDGEYYTDGDGTYEVGDFDLEDMIWVENSDGEIIAEIDPETGNIGDVDAGYYLIVNEAVPPSSPTSVDIVNANGDVMGTVYVFTDPNQDVKIHEKVSFDASNYKSLFGVNVSDLDLNDQFEFHNFPGSHPIFPGGATLVYTNEDLQILITDSAGNVLILDDRVTLKVKENDHKEDPLVINVLFNGKVIAEIYISTSFKKAIIVGLNDLPYPTPRGPNVTAFYGAGNAGKYLFDDVDPEFDKVLKDLYAKDIIDGVETDDGLLFNGDELINRSEFVKMLLKMLCIIPRTPEAYEAYKDGEGESGGGFSDMPFSEDFPWYYPYVKEADLLGLVHGYKGEPDSVSGLYPFKPNNSITRAEAANIILEALEFKGILDLRGLEIGEPWYVPFVEAAQDLTPYINEGYSLKYNYIITPEEAKDPNKELTREDLVLMTTRVLELYNCFEIDDNNNGMSDFCEEKYEISDPYADEDLDGLLNTNECHYGLNPKDQDTDQGGILDGMEFKMGTNPLDPLDDGIDDDFDGLTSLSEVMIYKTDPLDPDTDDGGVNDGDEVMNLTDPLYGPDDFSTGAGLQEGVPGLFIVPANCNSCPCISTFLHKADIIPGDILLTVISTYLEDKQKEYVFSKSKEVTIQ